MKETKTEQRHIILIDGPRLAQLMIEYEYGVSTHNIVVNDASAS